MSGGSSRHVVQQSECDGEVEAFGLRKVEEGLRFEQVAVLEAALVQLGAALSRMLEQSVTRVDAEITEACSELGLEEGGEATVAAAQVEDSVWSADGRIRLTDPLD